jgi:hypothetical protein
MTVSNYSCFHLSTSFHQSSVLTLPGADKSLARPRRKEARKHVGDARDFNNIETLAVINFFFPPTRQGAKGNSRHSDRNIRLYPSWSGYGIISTLVNPPPPISAADGVLLSHCNADTAKASICASGTVTVEDHWTLRSSWVTFAVRRR